MLSLFIDTHDKDIIVALYKDGILLDKEIKESTRNHSDYTMILISDLIKRNNITIHDINEILVINGPGSFTGVRIGVTIAKTLAYTLNVPIKTMSSLQMYAIGSKYDDKVTVIHDLKGVFAGLFNRENELVGEMFYKSNQEFNDYINEIDASLDEEHNIDFNKMYEVFKTIDITNAHAVNPIYIKVIEALKND